MTDYIYFKDARICDGVQSYDLEHSMRMCAALGGIHDFSFLATIDEDFTSNISNFDLDGAEGTWSIEDGTLKGTGLGQGIWYRLLHSEDVGPSFVATFDKISDSGAFVFGGGAYAAFWSATQIGFMILNADGVATTITCYNDVYTGDAEITVAVRYQQMIDFEVVDWISMAMYIDGRCAVSANHYIGGELPGNEVGFAVPGNETMYVDNFRISELHRLVEWTSADPGEAVSAGMSRAIGTTPAFFFCRYDGTLRAWIPGNRDLDWGFARSRVLSKASRDSLFVPAHIRMVGAYKEADAWYQYLAQSQARQLFALADDPNLTTELEAYDGALLAQRKLLESESRRVVIMPGNPLVEPQDRINDSVEDMRVEAVQFSTKKVNNAPTFVANLECTVYEEEDE